MSTLFLCPHNTIVFYFPIHYNHPRGGHDGRQEKTKKDIYQLQPDYLTLGRAALLKVAQNKSPDYTGAMTRLQQALEGLRASGYQYYIPLGLFARASCFRLQGDFQNAEADLTEAFEIAQSGGMLLFYVDYYLESARLWKDKGDMEKTKEHRKEARKWMKKTG